VDKTEKNEMSRACSIYGGQVCTGVWWGNMRGRDCWGDPGVDGRIILGLIIRKCVLGVWTVLGWLRIGTGGGHL